MAITNPTYVELYRKLHEQRPRYGSSSERLALEVLSHINEIRAKSVLDYGCGQSRLHQAVTAMGLTEVLRYDPAIAEIARPPVEPVDFVVCTDVLEHVPKLDCADVLAHIRSLGRYTYFVIGTVPARTLLPSGENAHVTVMRPAWWLEQIRCHYPESTLLRVFPHACAIRSWPSGPAQRLKRILYKFKIREIGRLCSNEKG